MTGDYEERAVTFEILEHIGVLGTFPTGWRREVNFVSWNGAPGKYDIREWSPDHEHMSRGLTFKENEMRLLLEVMKRRRVSFDRSEERQGSVSVAGQIAKMESIANDDAMQDASEIPEGFQKGEEPANGQSDGESDTPF